VAAAVAVAAADAVKVDAGSVTRPCLLVISVGAGCEPRADGFFPHPMPIEQPARTTTGDAAPTDPARPLGRRGSWQDILARFQRPAFGRSLWQLLNSLIPYCALWALMVWSLSVSYWLTLLLMLPAAGFLVRIFIIFHDCGHGSFFRSRRANDFWGTVAGILCFTPYSFWRYQHSVHHATSGDLDRRGSGDIWTLTVQEYLEASHWKRFAYRLARNPFVLFVLAPMWLFLFQQRVCLRNGGARERRSVHATNLALLAIAVMMSLTIGLKAYLLIQLPVMILAAAAGVWLFYVQHQFEGTYWERRGEWDYVTAALKGSSFYKLPKLLQWFSGNIGFHHIHHLSPSIPNYRLEECHKADPMFRQVKPVTLFSSLKCVHFRLWDEEGRRLVGFRHARKLRAARKARLSAR
jgi:omega-6 fatty acid desaturase (delta-12 desaturase)